MSCTTTVSYLLNDPLPQTPLPGSFSAKEKTRQDEAKKDLDNRAGAEGLLALNGMEQSSTTPSRKKGYTWRLGSKSHLLLAALKIGVPAETNKEFFKALSKEYNKSEKKYCPPTVEEIQSRWKKLQSDPVFEEVYQMVCNCNGSPEEKKLLESNIKSVRGMTPWTKEEVDYLLTSVAEQQVAKNIDRPIGSLEKHIAWKQIAQKILEKGIEQKKNTVEDEPPPEFRSGRACYKHFYSLIKNPEIQEKYSKIVEAYKNLQAAETQDLVTPQKKLTKAKYWNAAKTSDLLLAALNLGVPSRKNSTFFNELQEAYNKLQQNNPATSHQIKMRWSRLDKDNSFKELFSKICAGPILAEKEALRISLEEIRQKALEKRRR